MYAVIETGGKQYRVEIGTELEVELLDVEPGKTITLERVLLVADGDQASIGRPLVDGAAVNAEVLRQDRGDKVIVFKYRPKARRRVKKGHRQELTVLRISDIVVDGKSTAKTAAKAEQDAKTERQRLEEAAAAQAVKDAELAAKLAAGATAKAAPKKTTRAAKSATIDTEAAATAEAEAAAEAAAEVTAETTGKAETTSTAQAKPKARRAAPKATAAAETKAEATPPKATPAKPATPAKAKAAAPKKPRTTKKDE